MNEETQLRLKKQLEELKRELEEDLAANPDQTKPVELDTAIGRLSRMDAMQDQQMALELKRRTQLSQK